VEGPILIVEDDEAIRSLVQTLLSDYGYETVEARNGNEALEIVRRSQPRLVLLDKTMPDGDGTHFAREYRRMPGPHAPIVALCAARDAEEWSRSIDAAAVVIKPFDIDHLLAAVGSQVGPPAGQG